MACRTSIVDRHESTLVAIRMMNKEKQKIVNKNLRNKFLLGACWAFSFSLLLQRIFLLQGLKTWGFRDRAASSSTMGRIVLPEHTTTNLCYSRLGRVHRVSRLVHDTLHLADKPGFIRQTLVSLLSSSRPGVQRGEGPWNRSGVSRIANNRTIRPFYIITD